MNDFPRTSIILPRRECGGRSVETSHPDSSLPLHAFRLSASDNMPLDAPRHAMIPIDQTEFRPAVGDCLRACVASILELPLKDVPHFLRDSGSGWFDALDRWLAERFQLGAVLIRVTSPPSCTLPRGFCIASGPAPGHPKHSVVWEDGALRHDPHPQRIGLDAVHDLIVFTAPHPAAH